jgi:probable phosphoglycerate mutase
MPIFMLIRHGENDFVGKRLAGRLPGVHLNEKGQQQAEGLAATLTHAPICAIYSSPLERAMETAQPLAQVMNLPIQQRPGLMEINFGEWQGKTAKQLHRLKAWKIVQEAPSQMTFPGGESFSEAQIRIVAELDSISEQHAEKDLVACFSHCDAIRVAIAHYIGLPLDFFQRLTAETASINVLSIHPGKRPQLLKLNHILNFSFEEYLH